MENFDDFDCDGDDFMDDDFIDDASEGDSEMDDSLNDETQEDSEHEDNGIDIGWKEIAMAGSLSEEIADENRERRNLEKKMDVDPNDRHRKKG